MKTKRPPRNYINNADFLIAIKEYKAALLENREPKRRVSNYVGECFYKMVNGLGQRGNFSGYSFLQEMKDDAIENCITSIKTFDETRFDLPFAYFNRIAWQAFVRRIATEEQQNYLKHKNLETMFINSDQQHPEVLGSVSMDIIQRYEEKMALTKQKKADKIRLNIEALSVDLQKEEEDEFSKVVVGSPECS